MPQITQKLGFDAGGATRSLGNLTNKLRESTQALKDFQTQSGKGTGKVDEGLKRTKKLTDGMVVSWKTLARVIGTQIVVRNIAAIWETLKEGVARARELATAIEEIQTISGRGTGSGQLAADILAVSDAIGKSSQDLAEAYYQTLSNQVVETGQALEFTSQAAKLATITVSETKDAVNALSSVMNSYGFAAERAEHVAGTLFKTVELGRLRLSEIANVIGRVTPLTAAMGVSWEETAASIAVMTRQGVKADTAITQLRAVMTKIIRPTQEMRDIFHAWGVRDGREAVETFGGLNGVLSKLAEETGHSSEAMADLLRRVRTIVGQLSLMKDGGEALAETLAKIEGSSEELTKQWDLFTASDAHRLTVEINEFDNALNRAGLESLPKLVAGMGFLNDSIESISLGVRVLSGEFDEAGTHAEIMRRLAIKAGDEQRSRAKQFDEEQRARYDGLAEAAGKYYVGVQLEENKLAEIRDTGLAAVTDSVKAQGKDIVKFYKDASKSLEDFVEGITDTIKDNTEEIADIQRELNQDSLDAELDKWDNVYQKVAVLEKAFQAQRLKAQQALADLNVTEDSRDRALLENDIAMDLADQTLAVAEQGKHAGTILKAEQARAGVLGARQTILKRHNQLLAENKDQIEAANESVKQGTTDTEALVKERNKLIDSGALQSKNEKVREKARAVLDDLDTQLAAIASDAERADQFLQSLGLDTALSEVSTALTAALNASTIDWQVKVDSLHETFANEVFHLNAVIDPTGVKKAAADALKLEPTITEGPAGFGRTIDAAVISSAEDYEQNLRAIDEAQISINQQLTTMDGALNRASGEIREVGEGLGAASLTATRVRNAISGITLGAVESRDAVSEYARRLGDAQGAAIELNQAFRAATEQLRAGKELSAGQLENLRQLLGQAHFQGQIDEARTKAYQDQLTHLKSANVEAQNINAIQSKLPEKEAAEAVLKARDALIEQKDAGLDVAEAASLTQERIEAAKTSTDGVTTSVKKSTEAQTQQTMAAEETVIATEAIGTTAANDVMIINGVAQAYANVATQARLAAQAAAQVTGGAAQFHGGPMNRFFAAGGMVGRGQDKILTALSSGETVTNSRNSSRFASELNAINQGSQPVFREQGGPVTNVGDVNVTVNGGDSSQQTVREIGHALRREIKRGNLPSFSR